MPLVEEMKVNEVETLASQTQAERGESTKFEPVTRTIPPVTAVVAGATLVICVRSRVKVNEGRPGGRCTVLSTETVALGEAEDGNTGDEQWSIPFVSSKAVVTSSSDVPRLKMHRQVDRSAAVLTERVRGTDV